MEDVNVASESGIRIIRESDVVKAQFANELRYREVSAWPESESDRRMWAIERAMFMASRDLTGGNFNHLVDYADKLIAYINGEEV